MLIQEELKMTIDQLEDNKSDLKRQITEWENKVHQLEMEIA